VKKNAFDDGPSEKGDNNNIDKTDGGGGTSKPSKNVVSDADGDTILRMSTGSKHGDYGTEQRTTTASENTSSMPTGCRPTVTLHCPKCSRDFVVKPAATAVASFVEHVNHCDPEKKRKKSSKNIDLANNSDSPDNGTQATVDEILSEARPIDNILNRNHPAPFSSVFPEQAKASS